MMAIIHWNPDIFLFHIGSFGVRWYSLCWAIGLFSVYLLEHKLYKEQRIPEEKFDPLVFYCFFGILIGARLGHCLFYEPSYYLTHPLEMILPMKQDAMGGWHYTGYEGLASHGGTLGLMIGDTMMKGSYIQVTKSLLERLDQDKYEISKVAIRVPKYTEATWVASQRRDSENIGITLSDYIIVIRKK